MLVSRLRASGYLSAAIPMLMALCTVHQILIIIANVTCAQKKPVKEKNPFSFILPNLTVSANISRKYTCCTLENSVHLLISQEVVDMIRWHVQKIACTL